MTSPVIMPSKKRREVTNGLTENKDKIESL